MFSSPGSLPLYQQPKASRFLLQPQRKSRRPTVREESMLTLVLLHEGWLQYKYCSSPGEAWASRRVENRDVQQEGYSYHGARRLGLEA